MVDYNPREINEIPKIGLPIISIGKIPLINTFGPLERQGYEIVDTDEPNLLWENGSAMSWDNGQKILLERQKIRIWQMAKR